jgi:hypothetical protein
MEILGKSIPALQGAISSGLDSVSAGIAESVKATGTAALGIAQDSFSFEQMGIATGASTPAVSGVAEYPRPDEYFRRFPGTASDSPVSSLAISQTLSDPNFNAPKSLQMFSYTSGRIVDNPSKHPILYYWELASQTPGVRLNQPMDKGDDQLGDMYGGVLDGKAAASKLPDGALDAADRFGREKAEGTILDGVSYPATERYGQDKRTSSTGMNDASNRSIIVVGGKTSGTYFQTIDDSLTQFQSNPTQETSQLFGQQFSAVTDMVSTVSRTVELQQSLSLNRFTVLR